MACCRAVITERWWPQRRVRAHNGCSYTPQDAKTDMQVVPLWSMLRPARVVGRQGPSGQGGHAMQKDGVLAVVEDSWRQVDAAVAGLDEAALVEPGVVGAWSVKDLVGHVTAWEQRALHLCEVGRNGAEAAGAEGSVVEAYNATETARRRSWSPVQVQTEAAATRTQLRAALQSLTDEDWARPLRVGARIDPLGEWVGRALGGALSGAHASEHAYQIWSWREARERRRADALATLAAGRRDLLQALEGLSDAGLTRSGVDGPWSVRDILAHIAAWDRQVVLTLEAWLEGTTPPPAVPDVEGFNAQVTAAASGESPVATLLGLARTHADLLTAVARAQGRNGEVIDPDSGRPTTLGHLVDDIAGHERAHAASILAWRGQQ